ncbi:MAG: hypothetical protein JST82_08275 [Bacteroidetes bacterium]|nr:hypothetical protein [Bacteroidota bacterium]
MDVKPSGKGGTNMLHSAYWTIGKWFSFITLLLLGWGLVYAFAHSAYGIQGYEYTSLNTTQVRQINRILSSEYTPANNTNHVVDLTDTATGNISVNDLGTITANTCDMACRTNKVLVYLNSEFDNKIEPAQLEQVRQYITVFGPAEVGVFLSDYKLKVRSYFWLSGPMMYAELVSWVIIGVLCSLIFATSTMLRKASRKNFDHKDVLYQSAKIFYAPFIAVVILVCYNYIKHNTALSSAIGQGIIVFSFIIGFYSGRIVNFIDKFKQLLLPDNADESVQHMVIHTAEPAIAEVAPTVQKQDEKQEKFEVDENGTLNSLPATKKDDNEELTVEVEVKLDGSGLFDDEKNDLLNLGFNKAIVTLHNVNGKDIIAAKKSPDKDNLFIAHHVKPGIYIARATLTQKISDDQVFNLFGERTSYLTIDKPGLELYIRKYELVE